MPAIAILAALMAAEISAYVVLGPHLGLPVVLLELVGSALVGGLVMRQLGQGAVAGLRDLAARPGVSPATLGGPLAEGALTAMAAGCLMLPGLLTDALGLLMLIPPVRRRMATGILRAFGRKTTVHASDIVIDAEYVDLTKDRPPNSASGPERIGRPED